MIKKIAILILGCATAAVLIANYNHNPAGIIADLEKHGDIRPGTLRYRLNLFGFLPFGEATLALPREEELDGVRVYHLSAVAGTAGIISRVFRGDCAFDSYVDAGSFSPLLFKQKITVTGKGEVNKEASYDQKEGVMSIAGTKRTIFPPTYDPLSAVFYIRRMDLEKQKGFQLNINSNQKNYVLNCAAVHKNLSVRGERHGITMVRGYISRRDKNPYHKSRIEVVLLEDADNIPLLIKAFAGGIMVSARLVEIK